MNRVMSSMSKNQMTNITNKKSSWASSPGGPPGQTYYATKGSWTSYAPIWRCAGIRNEIEVKQYMDSLFRDNNGNADSSPPHEVGDLSHYNNYLCPPFRKQLRDETFVPVLHLIHGIVQQFLGGRFFSFLGLLFGPHIVIGDDGNYLGEQVATTAYLHNVYETRPKLFIGCPSRF